MVRKINDIFIKIILFLFYFIVIGFAYVIYKLIVKEKKGRTSYWQNIADKELSADYFQSPY